MIGSPTVSPDVIEKILIGLDRRTGLALLHDITAQDRAGGEPSADFENRDHHSSIQFRVEIVGADDRSYLYVAGFDRDRSTALRTKLTGAYSNTGEGMRLPE